MALMKRGFEILQMVIAYFDGAEGSVTDPGVDKDDIYLEFDGDMSEEIYETLWDILLEDGLIESLAVNADGILMYGPTEIGYEFAEQMDGEL